MQSLLGQGMGQSTYNMLLANECRKIARPPLSRENLVTHAPHTKSKNESGEPNPRHLQ